MSATDKVLLVLEEDTEVAQVARATRRWRPYASMTGDVTLCSPSRNRATGIEAAARLHHELPPLKLVVLTTLERTGYLRSAMESGADTFRVKEAPAAQLAATVRDYLSPRGP
ncbi:hypothetical protein DF19_11080 [Streptomyces olindensis]|nr:hypothetical protein DF19_11080 [Streptomyces olindensis]